MDQPDDRRERERATVLERYAILGTEPEPAFDRIAELAADVFATPIAAIAFPMADGVWCKSAVGLDGGYRGDAARSLHLLGDTTPLVLADASAEPRFRHHPMVAASPGIRFYACTPLITPDGQEIGTFCIADIRPRPGFSDADTARLRHFAALAIDALELRLHRKNTRAARMAGANLLSSMSHEIRTPMNGVIGMAELLLTAKDLSDRQRKRIEIIRRSGTNLLNLIDQILDLVQIETEESEPSPFEVREWLGDLVEEYRSTEVGTPRKLELVDRMHAPCQVIGDASRLRKLLSKLIDSARRHSAEGPIELVATAEQTTANSTPIRFEIRTADLDAAAIEQGLAAGDISEARLGLMTLGKLARMMGGAVGIDRLDGGRFAFWLHVDLAAAPTAARDDIAEPPSLAIEHASHAKPVRDILVAEDNPDMALLIEDLLEEAGYRATIAPDGASVLKLLGERSFDVVLMDGRMPDMSGVETTDRIRQLPDARADVPIIALTAEALDGDRERYLSAGMNGYVPKPVNYQVLVETIERCCC